jgi:hypothetical protein
MSNTYRAERSKVVCIRAVSENEQYQKHCVHHCTYFLCLLVQQLLPAFRDTEDTNGGVFLRVRGPVTEQDRKINC